MRRLGFQFLLWFLAALIVREAHFSFVADSPLSLQPTSDELEHWQLATHLAYTDWLGAERGAYHRPQLFAYVLAALMRLTGGRIYWIHHGIVLFDSLAVALIWLTARFAFTRRAAFWGGLAALSYWPFVHFSATIYMESFALLVQAGMLLALVVALRRMSRRSRANPIAPGDTPPREGSPERPRRRHFTIPPQTLWAGALTGLLLLTRPQTMIAVPVMLAALALAAWRGGRPWKAVLAAPILFIAMTGLVLLPNAVRNYKVSGQWIWYSSNGALSFYFSNNDRGISWESVNPGLEWREFIEIPRVEEGIGIDREARVEFWRRKSLAYVRDQPGHFARHFYDKLLLIWNARIVHCTNNFEWMAMLSPVQRILPGFRVWGTLGVAGLILAAVRFGRSAWRGGFRRQGGNIPNFAYSKTIAQAALGGYAVAYMTGVALFLAIERHRLLPLAPLFLFGGLWIAEWFRAARGRQWGLTLAALAATALVAAWVNWPLQGPSLLNHERYWTRVNLGVACEAEAFARRDMSWLDKAREHWIEAHEFLPGRLEPLVQLTHLEEALKRHDAALHWHSLLLRRLRIQYGSNVEILSEETAHHVLLALAAKNIPAAVDTARTLVRLIPANAQAHQYLGVALMTAGDADGARAEFEQVLRLAPTHHEARENLKVLDRDRETSPTVKPRFPNQ